jgi:hypothetical protein
MSPVVIIVIYNNERPYNERPFDGSGMSKIMVPVSSIQKWDTGFSDGILEFLNPGVPGCRKNFNFRRC